MENKEEVGQEAPHNLEIIVVDANVQPRIHVDIQHLFGSADKTRADVGLNGRQQNESSGKNSSPRNQPESAPHGADAGLNGVQQNKSGGKNSNPLNQRESACPHSNVNSSITKLENSGAKVTEDAYAPPEKQVTFMEELQSFYKERAMDFRPPKFYGEPLNCLKLWRAVTSLGGYEQVTASKLWRVVGECFHPPKTCTTVSWTFRHFYEKALLEYEKHKSQRGELLLPVPSLPEPASIVNEGSHHKAAGLGRARRDAATRAMQGWHLRGLTGFGEVTEPIIKDKNLNPTPNREKHLKCLGFPKRKGPSCKERSAKVARAETAKQKLPSVVDVGPPADWVKVNVRVAEDSFEVFALVPGLLREEVRVQSDAAGRLVITGQPDHPDSPWGITPFQKVINLPIRIDPLHTSAIVTLHGRLHVRVPFEA